MMPSPNSPSLISCRHLNMSPSTRSCIANSRMHLPTSTAPESRRTKQLVVRRARLDAELVRRGLARSRNQAAELVVAGRVRVAGQVASKVATAVGPDDALLVSDADQPTFVSRGAHKLAGAITTFGPLSLEISGKRCLD